MHDRLTSPDDFFLSMDEVAVKVMLVKFAAVIIVFLIAMICTCCLINAMRKYHNYEYKNSRCLNLSFMLAMLFSIVSSAYYLYLALMLNE